MRATSRISPTPPVSLLLAATLLALGAILTQASANPVFIEQNGLVVIERESLPAIGQWSEETSIPGFTGRSYYIWRGDNFFNPANAGRDTMRYSFRINTPGVYRLRWRSYIGVGNLGSEYNDTWIRFPTGQNVSGEQALNGWTKIYQGQLNTWSWDAWTVDFNPQAIRQFFGAGEHFFEVSGRSTGHAIDRIVLHQESMVPFSANNFINAAESPRSGDAAPQPAPAPAPQPAPEPTPAPAPVSNDGNTPATPVAVRAEVYSSTAAELFWARGDGNVVSYNIGRNGQFLDATNGTSYFMDDLTAGGNYEFEIVAVASDGSQSPAAKVILQAFDGAGGSQPSDSAPNAPTNASLVVYSSTAAELFWDRAAVAENVIGTDVYRDGLFIGVSPGTSFYDDSRASGVTYEYQLFARNANDQSSAATTVNE